VNNVSVLKLRTRESTATGYILAYTSDVVLYMNTHFLLHDVEICNVDKKIHRRICQLFTIEFYIFFSRCMY